MDITAPGAVGLSAQRLARVDEVMQGFVDRGEIPGAVTLLARRGKIVHRGTYGMLDREAGKPMRPDTIFRIYSMSKPVTCVAAMLLYEEGRFLLDDPLAQYIPAFKDVQVYAGPDGSGMRLEAPVRPLTIHHLLTHTSGLSYGGLPGTPLETLYRDAQTLDWLLRLQLPLDQLAEKLATFPLVCQPGTAWHYSLSHDVAGRLIEVVAGMPFDRFLAERIFKPLGMHDTGFYVPADKVERLAAMYVPGPGAGLQMIDAPATSPFTSGDYHPSGGSGLVSTANDYLRFAQMLLNGGEVNGTRLLSRKTVEFMTRNHLPASMLPPPVAGAEDSMHLGYGYGLGVSILMDPAVAGILGSPGQYGWDGAARTQFWVDPQEEMIGVVMAQMLPWPSAPLITDLYQVLAHQAIVD